MFAKLSEFQKLAEESDIVSFDLFDTLVKRDVAKSNDVFFLMELYLKENDKREAEGFQKKRIIGMKNAYQNAEGKEVTLQDIYSVMYGKCDESVQELMTIEEYIEKSVCTRNQLISPLLELCVESKKALRIITDTYLPRTAIMGILCQTGLNRYFSDESLYISSEVGLTKKSGELFQYILKKEGIVNKRWLHIGDAVRSDYLMPLKFGIKAVHVARNTDNCMFHEYYKAVQHKTPAINILHQFQNNRIQNQLGYYRKFGYECLGPVVWGFSNWLKVRLKGRVHSKILFLSREGQFLKKAYELICNEKNAMYFYASRQAVTGAIYWMQESIEEVLRLIHFPHRFDQTTLFALLGLSYESKSGNSYIYTSVEDVLKDKETMQYLNNHLSDIKRYSLDQYDLIKQYLDIADSQEIILIDIGWRGTMQNALEQVMHTIKPDVKVYGLYVGLDSVGIEMYGDRSRQGYLFDGTNDEDKIDEDRLFAFGGLFETLFMADHGSVKRYRYHNSSIVPVFHVCEYAKDYNKIREIQEGALSFLKDAEESILFSYLIENKPVILFAKLGVVGCRPRKREVEYLGKLKILDGVERTLAGDCDIHVLTQIKDELMNSGWKVAFIKKICPFVPGFWLYKKFRNMR